MRTTITLEDDVAAKLKALAERQKTSFKQTVNAVLRRGLTAPDGPRPGAKRFRLEPFQSPFRPGVDPVRLNQLSDEIEVQHVIDRVSGRNSA